MSKVATTTTAGAAEVVRQAQLEQAFAEGGLKLGDVTLRPFSLGTLSFCRIMKLTMFTGAMEGDEPEKVSNAKAAEQMGAFAWLQSAPLDEVKQAVRDGSWKQKVEDFTFNLDISVLGRLTAEVERIAKLADAAAVDVAKKPGETSEKGAPPNS